MVVRGGEISDVRALSNGDLFLSSTSLIDNSIYSVLSTSTNQTKVVSSLAQNGSKFGLYPEQISEVRWPGAAKNTSVHAWVIKPSNFSPTEKYPLAYLIHGGPQGGWEDSWSTRWNLAVFAEQGYVVIAPNPTGSSGYGQDFQDAIKEQWGGFPYEDLLNGFDWIEKNLDYVNTDRAVALGASYGTLTTLSRTAENNRSLICESRRLHGKLDPRP
jgi:dipeptidyl aminopeptidase/acylaminoacyl peptidase